VGVRRVRDSDLDRLEDALGRLRTLDGLTEKKRGVFYRRSSAFLHFHADGGDLLADLHGPADWLRYRVTTAGERRAFLADVRRVLRGEPARSGAATADSGS
jgi:hypothetical protein